jgi:hypothetical protein
MSAGGLRKSMAWIHAWLGLLAEPRRTGSWLRVWLGLNPDSAVNASTSMGSRLRRPKRVDIDQTTSPMITIPRRRTSAYEPTCGATRLLTIRPEAETLPIVMSRQCSPTFK